MTQRILERHRSRCEADAKQQHVRRIDSRRESSCLRAESLAMWRSGHTCWRHAHDIDHEVTDGWDQELTRGNWLQSAHREQP